MKFPNFVFSSFIECFTVFRRFHDSETRSTSQFPVQAKDRRFRNMLFHRYFALFHPLLYEVLLLVVFLACGPLDI